MKRVLFKRTQRCQTLIAIGCRKAYKEVIQDAELLTRWISYMTILKKFNPLMALSIFCNCKYMEQGCTAYMFKRNNDTIDILWLTLSIVAYTDPSRPHLWSCSCLPKEPRLVHLEILFPLTWLNKHQDALMFSKLRWCLP